jgi:uncharacterized protein YjiS (DUF1127 family)
VRARNRRRRAAKPSTPQRAFWRPAKSEGSGSRSSHPTAIRGRAARPSTVVGARATQVEARAEEIAVSVFHRFLASAAAKRLAGLGRAVAWLVAALIRTIGRLAAAHAERRRIKRAIHELRGWDDRRLRDIGLHPMDIERQVCAPDWPQHYEASAEPGPPQPAAPTANDNLSAASDLRGLSAERR